jgi:hypothetical protein
LAEHSPGGYQSGWGNNSRHDREGYGGEKMALNWGTQTFKVGDQIEWEATLNGRITVDKQMLDGARNELIR